MSSQLTDALLKMFRQLKDNPEARVGDLIKYFKDMGYELEDLVEPESPFNMLRANEVMKVLAHVSMMVEQLSSRLEVLERYVSTMNPGGDNPHIPPIQDGDPRIWRIWTSNNTGGRVPPSGGIT